MNFIENESKQKLRGGYYTPSDLAEFLSRWVSEKKPQRILEPSCGDGVFFEALGRHPASRSARVVGFEVEVGEAKKARDRARSAGLKQSQVFAQDFLHWAITNMARGDSKFDAALGNPPFVRYQYLPEPFQARAEAIF